MRQSGYQFGDFIISPARRQLIRDGREVPLIPRYFRVLLVLIQRRHEAVSRRDLLDSAWDDVVVTDNSLNQAVRILRQALGDDSRQPTYIRTVARHGYQFVYPHVSALPDEAPLEDGNPSGAGAVAAPGEPHDRAELQRTLLRAVEVLMDPELGQAGVEARLEAADRLHALGTEAALREIEGRPGAALARALLREARWEVPGAGEVPFLGRPGMWRSVWQLARLRLPRGSARVRVVLVTGLTCALGSGLLGWRGSYLGALSLDLVAGAFPGSQVALDPLARLLGELQPGPITRLCVSTWEGLMFGLGIALGLTRRPLSRAAGPRSGES